MIVAPATQGVAGPLPVPARRLRLSQTGEHLTEEVHIETGHELWCGRALAPSAIADDDGREADVWCSALHASTSLSMADLVTV
jgi:hypothetical protein